MDKSRIKRENSDSSIKNFVNHAQTDGELLSSLDEVQKVGTKKQKSNKELPKNNMI